MASIRERSRALIVALLLVLSVSSLADEDRTTQVMLVHGVWLSGPWERQFRESLSSELGANDGHTFELTEQFLGLYSYSQQAPIDRFSRDSGWGPRPMDMKGLSDALSGVSRTLARTV